MLFSIDPTITIKRKKKKLNANVKNKLNANAFETAQESEKSRKKILQKENKA